MIHRTLIISADQRDLCVQLCAALAGPSGEGMFTSAYTISGAEITHYASAGYIGADFASILPLTEINGESGVTITPGNAQEIVYLAAQAGMTVTRAQVDAMLNEADVSAQEAHAAIERLGLTPHQDGAV